MIYLIYSPIERYKVEEIVQRLPADYEYRFAPTGLEAGSEEWQKAVQKDFQECELAIAFLTLQASGDSTVMWRCRYAVENNIPFLPVFVFQDRSQFSPDVFGKDFTSFMSRFQSLLLSSDIENPSEFDESKLNTLIHSIHGVMNKRITCFLSYSRKDTDFAAKLATDLRKAKLKTWRDAEDIPAGANWDREIEKAIKNCTHVVLVATPSSVVSENVMDEVSLAISNGKTIVPVMLETCELPMRVHRAQWIDFRDEYGKGLNKLLMQLGVEKLAKDAVTYPLSPESIERRYADRAIVKKGLRLVLKDDFHESGALGTPDRKYVFIGDYEEQKGRTLKQIMNNLWLGDSFDPVEGTRNDWVAVVIDIDEANYKKFDVLPATWKAIFRILSHPNRLNIFAMAEQEKDRMGSGTKDYYDQDQQYWYYSLEAHPELPLQKGELLQKFFGLRNFCFKGYGITYASGGNSSVIPSRIFLIKNMPLNLINYTIAELGQPNDNRILE